MKTSDLLLKAGDIERMPGVRKVHFLNPNAVRINRSLGDAVGLQHIGVHLIRVAPGCESTEFHVHHYEEECVYVLSGCARIDIAQDHYRLEAGDFVGFPRGVAAHGILNDGDEDLVCLVIGQRLDQDISDYPHQGKRLYRHGGQWDLVDLAEVRDPR